MAKCGSTLNENNVYIPNSAKLKISPLGREYYISGIDENEYIIRYTDNGEIKRLPLSKINL